MKRLDLVSRLEKIGCVLLRHGGRHDIDHNPGTGNSEPVPRHREINARLGGTSAWSTARANARPRLCCVSVNVYEALGLATRTVCT